jgi:HAD superfamily hydrolase (TIGR01509 family)
VIDLVLFDLDGVLVDAKEIHYEALNEALREVSEEYIITKREHLITYDGLKTHSKLQILSEKKGLPIKYHDQVWERKQKITIEKISLLKENKKIQLVFDFLKNKNIKIGCCSNSIRKSVIMMLSKIGAIEYLDLILSNEDVRHPKPHPEIYWKAMSLLGKFPEQTLIVEDSPNGLLSGQRSGAKVMRVKNVADLTIEKLEAHLSSKKEMNTKWQDKNLNVIVPMAGAGSRFEKAGYTFPKPLIEVNGKPMIQLVVDNLCFESNYCFIVQKEHREKYNLDSMLSLIVEKPNIISVDGVTEGAACTTLLAKKYIDNDNPLIIANSDQFIEWNTSEFMYKMQEQDVDAGILTFKSIHAKWSFVKLDDDGYVTEVAEKNPISDVATVGIYFWRKGSDYVKYAEQMIQKNKRFNNEFYVCPVFNEAIEDGKKIKTFDIEKMWGLGTPEDLEIFLNNSK